MKRIHFIIALAMSWLFTAPAGATDSLLRSSEWPFTPPTLFLKGGVNAVTAGSDLLFWAIGDTVAVIGKGDFAVKSTFQVGTGNAVQDILFDDANDILYVAAGYDARAGRGGLQIFDIANPLLPALIKVYDTSPDNPGSRRQNDSDSVGVDVPDIDARGLGLYNTTLFLADDNFGLRVMDVSDPANPSEIDLDAPTADRTSGYKQPDVNDSFAATGGYINLSLYPYDDKVYAFVLDFYHGIKVFDVTDPAVIGDPVEKDTRTYFWYGAVSLLSDLFVNETGGRLTTFVTGGDATGSNYVVARLDVSFDEDLPIPNFGRCITPGEARSVTAGGDYAYVADGSSGLTVVDISDVPASGSVLTYNKVGSYSTNADFSYNVFLDGAVLYLATGQSGLKKLDVSVPSAPAHLSTMAPFISGDDVAVSGNYTYMLDRQRGLRIFDTQDPSYPLLRSFLPLGGESGDLAVSGNYAYIAKSAGSVAVVNISDKMNPVLTGTTIASPDPRKLFVSGNTLYIADGDVGLRIVNIADPQNPVILGTAATAGTAVSVYVFQNRAYMAEGSSGLEIFNVTAPAAPVLLASAPMTDARDVFVREAEDQDVLVQNNAVSVYALIADGAAGLKILDVTDLDIPLSDPVVVNKMETDTNAPLSFTAVSVTVLDNLAFVGLGVDGVLVLDIDYHDGLLVLDEPDEVDHEWSAGYVRDIVPQTIEDTPYITVSEGNIGFRILYLYSSSSDDDDDEEFVPAIDAGCFINAAQTPSSAMTVTRDWLTVMKHFFSFLFV